MSARIRTKSERGFSLLEVLLAALLLGLGLSGIMEGITLALRSHGDAARGSTAVLLAEGLMEEICAAGLPTSGDSDGDFGDAFPDYRYAQSVREVAPAGLHEVHISVEWGEGDEAVPLYQLSTLLFEAPVAETGMPEETAPEETATGARAGRQ